MIRNNIRDLIQIIEGVIGDATDKTIDTTANIITRPVYLAAENIKANKGKIATLATGLAVSPFLRAQIINVGKGSYHFLRRGLKYE